MGNTPGTINGAYVLGPNGAQVLNSQQWCNGDTFVDCVKNNGAWCSTNCKNIPPSTIALPVAPPGTISGPYVLGPNGAKVLNSQQWCNGDTFVDCVKNNGAWCSTNCKNTPPSNITIGKTERFSDIDESNQNQFGASFSENQPRTLNCASSCAMSNAVIIVLLIIIYFMYIKYIKNVYTF